MFYLKQKSVSTWNSHTPCVRCLLNHPQGVCGIQMKLPNPLEMSPGIKKQSPKKPDFLKSIQSYKYVYYHNLNLLRSITVTE